MNIAIIADDLTGANDTGAQLASKGLATSVLLDYKQIEEAVSDSIVIDTDSRSIDQLEAYQRVKNACIEIMKSNRFQMIYKKIDSTMRGNIGPEIDAVYDCFRPDFVVMNPAFPPAGRVVRNGHLYVHDVPLHLTDIAQDPKNPVQSSCIAEILQGQTKRKTALVKIEQLYGHIDDFMSMLKECNDKHVPYLLFDAETEQDLQRIYEVMNKTDYRIVWAGSAGLANALYRGHYGDTTENKALIFDKGPAIFVVGSVNSMSRRQLELVLQQPNVIGIEMRSEMALVPHLRESEWMRMNSLIEEAMASSPDAIVIYSAGEAEDVAKAKQAGTLLGMNNWEVSNVICCVLGEIAASVIDRYRISKLIMTGGDTAKQVCLSLGAVEIALIHEVSAGMPIGKLIGSQERYVITKAGGFGDEQSLCLALEFFRKERAE